MSKHAHDESRPTSTNISTTSPLFKTLAVSVVLIAFMAHVSFSTTSIAPAYPSILNGICLFVFVSIGILAIILIANPRFLKTAADNLCAKYDQLPFYQDSYYVMFLRQFGAYLLFLLYAMYLHPDLAGHFWKVMSACILIKCWHVQPMNRPIPLPQHIGEVFFLGVIGICTSLYSQRQQVADE